MRAMVYHGGSHHVSIYIYVYHTAPETGHKYHHHAISRAVAHVKLHECGLIKLMQKRTRPSSSIREALLKTQAKEQYQGLSGRCWRLTTTKKGDSGRANSMKGPEAWSIGSFKAFRRLLCRAESSPNFTSHESLKKGSQ